MANQRASPAEAAKWLTRQICEKRKKLRQERHLCGQLRGEIESLEAKLVRELDRIDYPDSVLDDFLAEVVQQPNEAKTSTRWKAMFAVFFVLAAIICGCSLM